MNPPSASHATPRRTLFGAAALMALAIPARAADHNPDADLIALCDQFKELERGVHAVGSGDAAFGSKELAQIEATQAALYDAQNTLLDRIEEMPDPTTLEGVRALLGAMLLWDPEFFKQDYCAGRRLLWKAVDGLVGECA